MKAGRTLFFVADPQIGRHHDVCRRLLFPIPAEFLEVEERQFVDVAVAVSAGGGEEALDGSDIVVHVTARSSPAL
jgi:hypothetical protein